MFVAVPAVLLVMLTITVQPPEGIDVPLAMVKLVAAAAAVTPAQVPVFPGVLMVIPAGKVSVNRLESVIAPALVLEMVTVRSVLPPLARSLIAKDFEIVGKSETVNVTGPNAEPVSPTGPVEEGAVVVLLLVLVALTL